MSLSLISNFKEVQRVENKTTGRSRRSKVISMSLSLPQTGFCGGRGFDINNVNVASNRLCCCDTSYVHVPIKMSPVRISPSRRKLIPLAAALPVPPPLDLTEDNIKQVLADARAEFGQIFDASVGITGQVELVELDGPFVKIRLKGRFWHKRSTVLARLANYLKQRIPEILEVDVEDQKQLDDSPENF